MECEGQILRYAGERKAKKSRLNLKNELDWKRGTISGGSALHLMEQGWSRPTMRDAPSAPNPSTAGGLSTPRAGRHVYSLSTSAIDSPLSRFGVSGSLQRSGPPTPVSPGSSGSKPLGYETRRRRPSSGASIMAMDPHNVIPEEPPRGFLTPESSIVSDSGIYDPDVRMAVRKQAVAFLRQAYIRRQHESNSATP